MGKGRKPELVAISGGKADIPEPPDRLNDIAKSIWHEHAPDLHSRGWLDKQQQGILADYCQASAILRKIAFTLDREELSFTGSNGIPKPHPLIRQANSLYQTTLRYAAELGLTQVAKVRAGGRTASGKVNDGAPPGLDI